MLNLQTEYILSSHSHWVTLSCRIQWRTYMYILPATHKVLSEQCLHPDVFCLSKGFFFCPFWKCLVSHRHSANALLSVWTLKKKRTEVRFIKEDHMGICQKEMDPKTQNCHRCEFEDLCAVLSTLLWLYVKKQQHNVGNVYSSFNISHTQTAE